MRFFINQQSDDSNLITDRLATWLMYVLNIFNTIVSVVFGLWALTG